MCKVKDSIFNLIKQVDRVSLKFLLPMTEYEGLFEIKVEFQSNNSRKTKCKHPYR